MSISLRDEIERAINHQNAESGSDTPDWILSEFLLGCLKAFDAATNDRARWYGHEDGLTRAFSVEAKGDE
jgi:hypothetical protein